MDDSSKPNDIWYEQLASLVEQMESYQQEISKAAEGVADRIAQPFVEFQEVFEETWRRFGTEIAAAMGRTANALERIEGLAALGWTLPTEMSLPEFHHLAMQDGLTLERVEQFFVDYYARDDASEFRTLKERLLSSAQLSPWKPLVEQVVAAADRGDYAICVPSLLLIVEGSIARSWSVKFQNDKDRKKFFVGKISGTKNATLKYAWKSVEAFIKIVFETAVSDRQEHPVPKRHLILHGKSNPAKWDRADCLRLFQAVSTILWIGDRLAEGDQG